MEVIVDINGYETPVHFPESFSEQLKFIDVQGDADNYVIQQGNLVEVGGTVEVVCDQSQTGHLEGSARVTYPEFTKVLDYHCVALDNNTGSLFEHAHLGQVENNGMNVYASVLGSTSKTIKVKWMIKGIIGN